jgi:REP element-mobilizing transposase RayT
MARSPRPQIAGGLYHVATRGNRRQRIFFERRDGEVFLSTLGDVIAVHRWRCHSYCLMPNHYHLLVETPDPDIALGMHRLNSRFAHWFNARHEVTGH